MATDDLTNSAPRAGDQAFIAGSASFASNDAAELSIPDPRDFPLLQLAYQTYLRDLPELLAKYPDQFVAYHGATRLGIADSPWDLEAQVAKLPLGEGALFTIQPEEDPNEDRSPAFL
ncbi:MAG: hypothetical protein L0211_13945 [Planctomycetaceae bacterium]|nr:hypothetical protein [Planctomycetaceae bacterium]